MISYIISRQLSSSLFTFFKKGLYKRPNYAIITECSAYGPVAQLGAQAGQLYALSFEPVAHMAPIRFASIWTSITCPIFPSNFLSGFSDFPLKIEYLKNPFFITFLIDKWPIWAVSSAGRARRSHPYGRTSHGSGPFPISSPIFWTIPSKSNILKIRFSQLFSMKNGQYGLVAQLGERCVRIHMDLHYLPDFSFQFSVRFFGLSPQN